MKSSCILRAVILWGSVALAGCGSSLDKAAKADIDQRISAMTPSGAAFPSPAGLNPKPIARGQWTLYKLVNDKGQPSLMTYKVVGEDGGAYWVEIAIETYSGKTVNKILLTMGDRSNPAGMEILAVKMKDKQGKITELQGPMLQQMKPLYQSSVNMLAVSWRGLPQENASVIAGSFSACFKAMTGAGWGIWRATSTSWMHPNVPISGLVKSIGISQPSTVELVGFGDEGATSEIP